MAEHTHVLEPQYNRWGLSERLARFLKRAGAIVIVGAVIAGGSLVGNEILRPKGGPVAPPAEVTANVWMKPDAANDCTAGRSSTLINYTTAVAQSNVCRNFERACQVATGGDKIAVKNGVYASDGSPYFAHRMLTDCSDGLGNSVDPNWREKGIAETVPTNWVTFVCGDTGTKGVEVNQLMTAGVNGGQLWIKANLHAIWDGRCFYFHSILLGAGDDSVVTARNIQFKNIYFEAFQMRAPQNVLVKDSEGGPFIICGQFGGAAPDTSECQDPGFGPFEVQYRNVSGGTYGGSSAWEGKEAIWFGINTGGFSPDNVRVDNVWFRDYQSRNATLWHSACNVFFDMGGEEHNVVLNAVKCERYVFEGIFLENSHGITVQNSQISCPIEPIENGFGWAGANCNQMSIKLKRSVGSWAPSNIIFRYNSTSSPIDMGNYGSNYTNVKAIGNISPGFASCEAGVVFDYNVVFGGGGNCGTNQNPESSSPLTDTTYSNAVGGSTSELDFHLTSGTKDFENWIPSSVADSDNPVDMDGATRTAPRDAGADER